MKRNDRNPFYSDYQPGFQNPQMNPQMNPMMQGMNPQGYMPYQGNMPYNPNVLPEQYMNYYDDTNDYETRLSKLERQVRKLEARVSKIESRVESGYETSDDSNLHII